jgi:hypothetical protein
MSCALFLYGHVLSRTESSDLLSVLDELDTDTLANGRVGLLGLDTDLLEDDTLGVRRATEGRGLVGGTEKTLLVVEIGPTTLTAGVLELAGGVQTSWLSFTHDCCKKRGMLVDGLSRKVEVDLVAGARAVFGGEEFGDAVEKESMAVVLLTSSRCRRIWNGTRTGCRCRLMSISQRQSRTRDSKEGWRILCAADFLRRGRGHTQATIILLAFGSSQATSLTSHTHTSPSF